MYEAIEMHIEGLLEDKLPIPESKSFAEYVAVAEKSCIDTDVRRTHLPGTKRGTDKMTPSFL